VGLCISPVKHGQNSTMTGEDASPAIPGLCGPLSSCVGDRSIQKGAVKPICSVSQHPTLHVTSTRAEQAWRSAPSLCQLDQINQETQLQRPALWSAASLAPSSPKKMKDSLSSYAAEDLSLAQVIYSMIVRSLMVHFVRLPLCGSFLSSQAQQVLKQSNRLP